MSDFKDLQGFLTVVIGKFLSFTENVEYEKFPVVSRIVKEYRL